MKLLSTISLFIFFSICVSSIAEQPGNLTRQFDKCGIVRYNEYKNANDPSLLNRIKEDEENLQRVMNDANALRTINTVYTIPVVVHVIYNPNQLNISDAQIQSQIDVLNEDFGRTNPNASNTPNPFVPIASSTNFQFCLAKRDPNGSFTNGIERRQTSVQAFGPNDQMKFFSSGGLDAWDVDRYLNIWVCSLQDRILGFGDIPTSMHTNTYGVVVKDSAFGRIGTVIQPYNLGRTCTHEISHCFDLYHIWGDADSCAGTDFVSDTPNQLVPTYGCHGFPYADYCTPTYPGTMYMNYMDYSDDNCMNMFTGGQATRMINSISLYYPLLLSSTGCMTSGVEELSDFNFSVYPNPTSGILNLDLFTTKYFGSQAQLRITDALGKAVLESFIGNLENYIHQIDLRQFPNGIYFLTVFNDKYKRTERFALTHN